VAQQAASARLVLLWVVGGLAVVGTMLAFAAVRMVGELRSLYARERAAAQAKTDFLADIAHELRTPLTVLRTNADVGLSLDWDGPPAPLFREIVTESERMTRLLQDLLLLARSDSVELPLEREPAQMAPFLADLSVRAQTLALERGATLEVQLSGEGRLSIDRARVEQVVLILVDNAVKYSPPGGSITLSTSAASDHACIEVADRGFGIPEDELPYVFDRFYRADRLKPRVRKVDGAGLGLSIAKTIVEAHGGRISARSRTGGGTCVAVCLPLIPSAARARIHS
jgi:signal transduction histidine kinase